MSSKIKYILIGLSVLVLGLGLLARSMNLGPLGLAANQATPIFSNQAIGGYDPVAYFTEKAAVPGSESFQHEWNGALWNFKNKENLEKFKSDPQNFAPRYGGHCAFAIGQGLAAGGDPQVWEVVNGKLYLNANQDAQADWQKAQAELIASGDKNWQNR